MKIYEICRNILSVYGKRAGSLTYLQHLSNRLSLEERVIIVSIIASKEYEVKLDSFIIGKEIELCNFELLYKVLLENKIEHFYYESNIYDSVNKADELSDLFKVENMNFDNKLIYKVSL